MTTVEKWHKEATQEQKKEMRSVLKTIKAGNIYARVDSVSRSGMSRRILFFRANGKRIENITAVIAWLAGYVKPGEYKQGAKWLREDGLYVQGVGMDMIFATLYNCMPYEQAKNWNQRYNTI